MATQEEDKKTLVVPEAGDATEPKKDVQDYSKPDGQEGTELKDNTPTLTEQQLNNIQHTPDGVSISDINKVPGKTEPKLKGTANLGVIAGAPSQVVIQHMLNQLPPMETKEQREKRERRERINKTFAALGDGFSSLANIYYATKGAPAAEGKTLSAGETERQEKARKERESAVDRRIRLLKEQLAERHRQEELKLQKELNDARVQWYGTQGKAKLQDADTNTKTKTIKAVAEQEYLKGKGESETELNKKKGKYYEDKGQEALDKGKAAKTTAGAAATKAATDKEYKNTLAKNSTAKTNAYVSDKEDQKKKRKDNTKTGGNSYTNTKNLGL